MVRSSLKSKKLLQISDCHLFEDPNASYRGNNADDNLARITVSVRNFDPDLLMLTGDLSEDGSKASYVRLRDWALRLSCPVAWIPGNHDELASAEAVFGPAGFDAGPVVELGAWQFALLDSSWPDDPGGELNEQRLASLEELEPGRPAGVFVHHQPAPVGAHWIDKVGMRSPGTLWRRLQGLDQVRFIAFGHVHQRFRQKIDGIECLACPSTAANSHPATARFTPGETTPMARWYMLGENHFRSGYLAA